MNRASNNNSPKLSNEIFIARKSCLLLYFRFCLCRFVDKSFLRKYPLERDELKQELLIKTNEVTRINKKYSDLESKFKALQNQLDTQSKQKSLAVDSIPTPDSRRRLTTSGGSVYELSSEDYLRLESRNAELVKEKQALDQRSRVLEAEAADIETKRVHLDSYSTVRVSLFNAQVSKYNETRNTLESDGAAYNRKVLNFTAELEKVGILIDSTPRNK